jgi:hypothetical protein
MKSQGELYLRSSQKMCLGRIAILSAVAVCWNAVAWPGFT